MNDFKVRIGIFVLFIILSAQNNFPQNNDSITPAVKKDYTSKIVWSPDAEEMNNLSRECAGKSEDKLSSCLIDFMIKNGANSEAVSFARKIGGMGYARNYKEGKNLGVAYVYYPFNQINKNGVFIVNSKPGIIDVNDDSNFPMDEIETNRDYKSIEQRFKHLAIFPEGTGSTEYPVYKDLGKAGEAYLVKYRLKDGCKDCQLLGYLSLSFNFDTLSTFKNVTVAEIQNLVPNEIPTVNNSVLGRVFINPSQPINVNQGEDFIITLEAKSDSKYNWKLSNDLDTQMIEFVGSDYAAPYYRQLPNSTGKYIFRFKAISKGNTKINFDYVPSWGGKGEPGQKASFNVNIN